MGESVTLRQRPPDAKRTGSIMGEGRGDAQILGIVNARCRVQLVINATSRTATLTRISRGLSVVHSSVTLLLMLPDANGIGVGMAEERVDCQTLKPA